MSLMRKVKGVLGAALALVLAFAGCAAKKPPNAHDAPGYAGVNHPTFNGPVDFCRSLGRVGKIFVLGRYGGGWVERPWIQRKRIDPAFREKLCLVVTINNRCVG